jgi:hypothetical protein
LSSAINLSVSGLPEGATATFNPAYLSPGTSSQPVTLTITTASTQAQSSLGVPAAFALLLIPLVGLMRRGSVRLLGLALLGLAGVGLSGCGDRANSVALSSQIKSYAITVTGTATGPTGAILSHSVVVTLGIQSGQ